MVKKRGLGKSLDALLSYTNSQSNMVAEPNIPDANTGHDKLTVMPLQHIQAGKYQPRREMDKDALEALAQSIRSQGILQPLLIRALPDRPDRYEIIAGERRFRAAHLAGLANVPVIIRDVPDEAAIAIALIENIQREDLNPVEEATALQRLIDEFGLTHEQTAEAVGKSRAAVTNLLRLLALPDDIKSKLERGLLEMGHARCLITLPEGLQLDIVKQIIMRQLSVRETEELVKSIQTPTKSKSKKPVDPDIARLETSFSQRFKLPVTIQCHTRGKGKLVIQYKNLSQLDYLLNQFEEA